MSSETVTEHDYHIQGVGCAACDEGRLTALFRKLGWVLLFAFTTMSPVGIYTWLPSSTENLEHTCSRGQDQARNDIVITLTLPPSYQELHYD